MALSNFLPVPNAPLIADDPARDAIWRRWLEEFSNRVVSTGTHNNLSGLQGGTTNEYYHLTASQHSTVTSFGAFTNNRVLITSPTSTITTSGDITFNSATSTFATHNATIDGQTLTVNASSWVVSSFIATNSVTSAPAGIFNIQSWNPSSAGDSAGTSDIRFNGFNATVSGANAVASAYSLFNTITFSGTSTLASCHAILGTVRISSTGNATNIRCYLASIQIVHSGAVTTADNFLCGFPSLTSTGTITTHNGYRAANMGSSLITTAIGFKADNFTGSTNMRGFQSSLTSGTGKFNAYFDGTADNAFAGNVRIGSTVAPTVALDVTGNIAGSGGIALATATKVSSYTATISDFTILANASGTAFTVTLPHASSLPNKIYAIKKTDSSGNAVTVSSVSNIDGATTSTLAAQFNRIMLQSNSTQWWEI